MKVLVTGSRVRIAALQNHPIAGLQPDWHPIEADDPPPRLSGYTHILDLNLDEAPQRLQNYASLTGVTVLGCAVKQSLLGILQLLKAPLNCSLFGANLLPGFLERHIWEVSSLPQVNRDETMAALAFLPFSFLHVTDQVGMVSARVVCRIINEAYYMLQEVSASRADIELAMKLGVNYPYGPFTWAERIGLTHVYEVLAALQAELGADQYAICPLLKRTYLSSSL